MQRIIKIQTANSFYLLNEDDTVQFNVFVTLDSRTINTLRRTFEVLETTFWFTCWLAFTAGKQARHIWNLMYELGYTSIVYVAENTNPTIETLFMMPNTDTTLDPDYATPAYEVADNYWENENEDQQLLDALFEGETQETIDSFTNYYRGIEERNNFAQAFVAECTNYPSGAIALLAPAPKKAGRPKGSKNKTRKTHNTTTIK